LVEKGTDGEFIFFSRPSPDRKRPQFFSPPGRVASEKRGVEPLFFSSFFFPFAGSHKECGRPFLLRSATVLAGRRLFFFFLGGFIVFPFFFVIGLLRRPRRGFSSFFPSPWHAATSQVRRGPHLCPFFFFSLQRRTALCPFAPSFPSFRFGEPDDLVPFFFFLCDGCLVLRHFSPFVAWGRLNQNRPGISPFFFFSGATSRRFIVFASMGACRGIEFPAVGALFFPLTVSMQKIPSVFPLSSSRHR